MYSKERDWCMGKLFLKIIRWFYFEYLNKNQGKFEIRRTK